MSTAEDEGRFALEQDLVVKTESFDFVRRLMAFASATLEDRELVDLSVVAAGLFLKEVVSEPLRLEVARNAEGVRAVSFLPTFGKNHTFAA